MSNFTILLASYNYQRTFNCVATLPIHLHRKRAPRPTRRPWDAFNEQCPPPPKPFAAKTMWLAKCSPTSSNKLLIDNHQRVTASSAGPFPSYPIIATTPDSASNRSTLSRRYQHQQHHQCRRPDYVRQSSIVATANNHSNHHSQQHQHLQHHHHHHAQTTLGGRSALISPTTKLSVAMEIHIQQQCVSA